jgi:malic enzyme
MRYIRFDEKSPLPVIHDDFLGTGAAISGPLLFQLAIQDMNVKNKSTSVAEWDRVGGRDNLPANII